MKKYFNFKKFVALLTLLAFVSGIMPLNGLFEFMKVPNNAMAFYDSTEGKMSSSYTHRLVVRNDGTLWGWGYNNTGELGNATITESNIPIKIMDNVKYASAGYGFSAAIKTDGSLWMFGSNDCGKLGISTGITNAWGWTPYGIEIGTNTYIPTKIMDGVKSVSLGLDHGLAVKDDGTLWGWGNSIYGQLVNPIHNGVWYDLYAKPIKLMDDVSYSFAGNSSSFAIKRDGSLWNWGYCPGTSSNPDAFVKRKVMDGVKNVMIGAYYSRYYIINNAGELFDLSLDKFVASLRDSSITYLSAKLLDNVKTCFRLVNGSIVVLKNDGTLWGDGVYRYLLWSDDLGTEMPIDSNAGMEHLEKIAEGIKDIVAYNNGSNEIYSKMNIVSGYMAIDKDDFFLTWGRGEYMRGDGIRAGYRNNQPHPIKLMDLNGRYVYNSGLLIAAIQKAMQIDIDKRMQKSQESMISDPIDSASGAQFMSKYFLNVKGAIDFGFDMKYNSLLLNTGMLGKAWSHGYEATLTKVGDYYIRINWGANNISSYQTTGTLFQSTNPYTPYENISMDANNNYVLKKQDGTKYIFDTTGKLFEIDNRTTQKLLLAYDATNRLSTVSETITGKKLTLSYDTSNRIIKVDDDLGRYIAFTYDSLNNLKTIREPVGYTTTYTHNNNGQILNATDSELRTIFTNTYDIYGRILAQSSGNLTQITTFDYDEETKSGCIITKVTDRTGNTKTLTHDSSYQLLSVLDEAGKTTNYTYDTMGNRTQVTDAKSGITKVTYDARGNILTSTDPLGRVTTFSYDSNDNLLSIVNADGKVKSFTYNENNNLLTETDSLGNITNYTYDANGLLLSKKLPEGGITGYTYTDGLISKSTDPTGVYHTFLYDAAGRKTTVTDAANKSTTFLYDNNDNVKKVTNPLAQSVESTFDGYGNKLTSTDSNGKVTNYEYNANGKVISVTDPLNNKTQFEYDAEDRLTKVTDAKGSITTFTLDAKGRKTQSKDPLGNITKYEYDELDKLVSVRDPMGNKVATNSYDSVGNLLSTTDALARVTATQYDALNRVKQNTNPINKLTKMFYDSEGKLISVTDAKNQTSNQVFNKNSQVDSVADLNGNTTNFTYDAAGRLSTQTKSSNVAVTNTYNNLGQLQNVVNGRVQTATFTYDDAGKVVSMTDPVSSNTYTYDSNGNVLSVLDSKGTISYLYDSLNRVTQYTDINGNVLKYEYDANSNLVTLTYPDNKVVTYTYDVLNRMTNVTDWASRVTTYTYDADSRLTNVTNADDSTVWYTYDAMGQITAKRIRDKNANIIAGYVFNHDDNGNITKEKRTTSKNIAPLSALTMTYDIGNQGKTFNNQNLVYDADGNMTTGPLKGTMGALTYDARNRLLTAGELTYDYDALGNRLSVTNSVYSTKTTDIVNPIAALSQKLVEKDKNSNVMNYYVYGLGLIGMQTADGSYYTYHYDRRGSTIALTNIDSTITDKYTYGPFGELLSKTGSTRNQFLYDGRDGVVTDENGLYFMRARYYSTDLKRFVNEDTVLGGIMNGQSLNRFAYVNGNPVSMVDPLGREGTESGWNKFKKIFEVEAGYGAGLGAQVKLFNIVNVEVGGYADRINYRYQGGESSLSSKIDAGVNIEILKNLKLGADYYVTNDIFKSQNNDPLVGINEDPNAEKNWMYGLKVGKKSIIGDSSLNDGSEDYKIPFGVSAAVGIAGQAEVRFNVTKARQWWEHVWQGAGPTPDPRPGPRPRSTPGGTTCKR